MNVDSAPVASASDFFGWKTFANLWEEFDDESINHDQWRVKFLLMQI